MENAVGEKKIFFFLVCVSCNVKFTTDQFFLCCGKLSCMQKELIVFGASGFVGSHIVKRALQCGTWKVVGACRSGKPLNDESWCKDVQWVAVDAMAPSSVASFFEQHSNPAAVVSTIGALLPGTEKALKINGTTNVNVFTAARDLASLPKLVFVSAAVIPVASCALSGYYAGKREVEVLLEKTASQRSAVMMPGVVHGPRAISAGGDASPWSAWHSHGVRPEAAAQADRLRPFYSRHPCGNAGKCCAEGV